MHRELVYAMTGKRIYRYYLNVKQCLLKDEDNHYGWHFSPEDFYVFMIAHEYKHYSNGGTGLRSLLDTYVFLKSVSIDMDYVAAESEKLGIADFEQLNRTAALHLFSGKPLTDTEQKMLERSLSSGTYGREENIIGNQIGEKGRFGYFLSRLTLPLPLMYVHYPILRKTLLLYPICWVHRLLYGFIFKNKKFMQQLKDGLTWQENNDEV